ncbi:MAG: hypothetical protein R3E79_62270 [Caldilineaceae bacterium]
MPKTPRAQECIELAPIPPWAVYSMPAATAAGVPLEPPGVRSRFHLIATRFAQQVVGHILVTIEGRVGLTGDDAAGSFDPLGDNPIKGCHVVRKELEP